MFVCVSCNRQMRPKKNGFEFIEMAKRTGNVGGVENNFTFQSHFPYKVWSGDLWECQDCGTEIVYTDPRQTPLAEHYQPGFEARCEDVAVSALEWTRA